MARAKQQRKPREPQTVAGINLQNVSPIIPPDNEHTHAGTIQQAQAVVALAEALGEAARALGEIARGSQRAGVMIANTTVSGVGGTGIKVAP